MVVSALFVGGLLVAVVATQALVNQTSFRMRDLQEQTKATRQTYVQLRLQVADLSAPERIAVEATRLGLRLPDAQELQVLRVQARAGQGTDNRPPQASFGLKGLIGEHP
jgi:cell division protein FtsL